MKYKIPNQNLKPGEFYFKNEKLNIKGILKKDLLHCSKNLNKLVNACVKRDKTVDSKFIDLILSKRFTFIDDIFEIVDNVFENKCEHFVKLIVYKCDTYNLHPMLANPKPHSHENSMFESYIIGFKKFGGNWICRGSLIKPIFDVIFKFFREYHEKFVLDAAYVSRSSERVYIEITTEQFDKSGCLRCDSVSFFPSYSMLQKNDKYDKITNVWCRIYPKKYFIPLDKNGYYGTMPKNEIIQKIKILCGII